MADTTTKRRGRKPLAEHERRTVRIASWLTREEARKLDERRGDKARGEFMRDAAMNYRHAVVPAVNAKACADLGKVLAGVDFIRRATNAERMPSIESLEAAVAAIRVKLLGLLDS